MGKFRQFLTELSSCDTSRFLFPHDYFSKYQLIFTKLAMCINIAEVCFGDADRQILSTFDRVICPGYDCGRVLSFHIFFYFLNVFY